MVRGLRNDSVRTREALYVLYIITKKSVQSLKHKGWELEIIREILAAARRKNVSSPSDISLIILTDGALLYVGDVKSLGAKASTIHPVDLGLTFISSMFDLDRVREGLESVKGKKIDPKVIVKEVRNSYAIPYEKVKSIEVRKPWIPWSGKAKITVITKDGSRYEYRIWHPVKRASRDTYKEIIEKFGKIPKLRPAIGGS